MVPTTAQRTIDIHKSAPRPRAKPMLAKAAKVSRMLIRTKKRMSTWAGRSSRDRFGSWATTQNSGVGWFAAQPKLSQQSGSQSALAAHDKAGRGGGGGGVGG